MNKEVKEIYLTNLKWIKNHDNMGGVICNLIFKDNMSYDDYQKLFKTTYFVLCNKDYITSLEKENKRLNNITEELEKDIDLELYKTRTNDEYNNGLFNAFRYVKDTLDKLKEL